MPGADQDARAAVMGIALLVPMIRFGPRYVRLAAGDTAWVDTAMDRDSRAAAALANSSARAGDTLFVWGFRPELFVYTGLRSASRFLDSQPLNGVPADRHLVDSRPVAAELAEANRRELVRSKPDVVMDGLGLYNPKLAIGAYPDLEGWMANYREVSRTPLTVIYRRVAADGSHRTSVAPQE